VSAELSFATRLEMARQLIAGREQSSLPPHELDQIEAAVADSHRIARDAAEFVRFVQPDRGWAERTSQSSMATEQRAYLAAALLACTRCVHLRTQGPQPAIARLALRRLDCCQCVQTFRKPPPEDEDRCDVCGEHGVEQFVPFLCDSGPVIVGGDACPSCARVLGSEEEAFRAERSA